MKIYLCNKCGKKIDHGKHSNIEIQDYSLGLEVASFRDEYILCNDCTREFVKELS